MGEWMLPSDKPAVLRFEWLLKALACLLLVGLPEACANHFNEGVNLPELPGNEDSSFHCELGRLLCFSGLDGNEAVFDFGDIQLVFVLQNPYLGALERVVLVDGELLFSRGDVFDFHPKSRRSGWTSLCSASRHHLANPARLHAALEFSDAGQHSNPFSPDTGVCSDSFANEMHVSTQISYFFACADGVHDVSEATVESIEYDVVSRSHCLEQFLAGWPLGKWNRVGTDGGIREYFADGAACFIGNGFGVSLIGCGLVFESEARGVLAVARDAFVHVDASRHSLGFGWRCYFEFAINRRPLLLLVHRSALAQFANQEGFSGSLGGDVGGILCHCGQHVHLKLSGGRRCVDLLRNEVEFYACLLEVVDDVAEVTQVAAEPIDGVANYVVATPGFAQDVSSSGPGCERFRPGADTIVNYRLCCVSWYNGGGVGSRLFDLILYGKTAVGRVFVADAIVKECCHG